MFMNHNSASLAKHFKNIYYCTQTVHGASIKAVEGQPYMLLNITKKTTPEALKEAPINNCRCHHSPSMFDFSKES